MPTKAPKEIVKNVTTSKKRNEKVVPAAAAAAAPTARGNGRGNGRPRPTGNEGGTLAVPPLNPRHDI